jgi:hypothetical protein
MLFLQGTRDELANLPLLEGLIRQLGQRATLKVFDGADHSFRVSARQVRAGLDIRAELLDALSGWISLVMDHGQSSQTHRSTGESALES